MRFESAVEGNAVKKIFFLFFVFYAFESLAYSYSYVPHEKKAVVYNFLANRNERCTQGTRYPYPKKAGVCAHCPQGGIFTVNDETKSFVCLLCPDNALLVKRFGYAMCVADKPYKPTAQSLTFEEKSKTLEKIASALSADYTVEDTLVVPKKSEKEKLADACTMVYPTEKSALRAVSTCKKLKESNDFLCPYVEKDSFDKWTCRACPKNAPYKNKDGGCFTCPYGEEIVSLENGKTVCASEMQKKPAQTTTVKKTVHKNASKK